MMENDYVADGWLGFIVGAKFWIDFKREENMGDSLEALLREIEAQINKDVAKGTSAFLRSLRWLLTFNFFLPLTLYFI